MRHSISIRQVALAISEWALRFDERAPHDTEIKECILCGSKQNLEYHHVFFGANRKISDEHGFTCYLCHSCHTGSNEAVHCKNGKENNLILKQLCQLEFEETHTQEEFIKLIGKSYL